MLPSAIPGSIIGNQRFSPKLSATANDGAFQQALLIQILEECREAPVYFRQFFIHLLKVIFVRIPFTRDNRYKRYPLFHEATGQ